MTLGVFCALSFGLLNGIRLGGMTIFDLFDFVTAKLMLPLGGMFISIFTGWYLDRRIVREEVTDWGKLRIPVFRLLYLSVEICGPSGHCFHFCKRIVQMTGK